MVMLKSLILAIEARMLGQNVPSSEARSQLRKAQVRRAIAITPLMMMANIANALMITLYFAHGTLMVPVLIWCGVLLTAAFTTIIGFKKFQKKPEPVVVGTKIIRNLTVRSAVLSIWWGFVPIYLFYDQAGNPSALVTGIIAGMLGGACVALSFIPSAMLAFVIPITLMAAASIAQGLSAETLTLASLMIVYASVLVMGGYGFASSFAKTVSSSIDVREKAETISMLLNEYEEGARDWLWEADVNGQLTRGAREFAAPLGIDVADWNSIFCLKQECKKQSQNVLKENYEEIRQAFLAHEAMKDVNFGIGFNPDNMYWFEISGRPLFDATGAFSGYRGFAKNRTEEVQDQLNIAYLAGHDGMTGLYNRATFLGLVNEAVAGSDENSEKSFAVLYIDLDGFKQVNDAKGHAVGDAVLAEVARRLPRCGEADTRFARIGGDEFAALVRVDGEDGKAEQTAEGIVRSLCQPIHCGGHEVNIGASVGIAYALRDGVTSEAIVSAADVALYHAKASGKNCFRVFDSVMNEELQRGLKMREALKNAVHDGNLTLAFQPFFGAGNERLAGFEALARWDDAEFGSVPPSVFIPMAEEAGLIDTLGEWVLREACYVAREWPPHLRLAVNVSVPQFHKAQMHLRVAEVLKETGLEGSRLELELTEAVFAERADEVLEQILKIKELGVSISLDDFGTGYSSLMYLIKFPFDKLKIDQSFVKQAQRDENALSVLNTIAELGSRLNMKTTIEGVENTDQLPMVSSLNCTYVQGYHFGRPLDVNGIALCMADEARKMIASHSPTDDHDFDSVETPKVVNLAR